MPITPLITETPTDVALFVGRCSHGPVNVPTRVHGYAEFEKVFGVGPSPDGGEMSDQMRMFFTNGGSKAYVLRLSEKAQSSPFQGTDLQIPFNLLVVPKTHAGQSDKERQDVYKDANLFASRHRAFLIMDPPYIWGNVQDITKSYLGNCCIETMQKSAAPENAAVYWPRLQIAVGGGRSKYIGPCGAMAGIMARTDARRGVWKAPAGLEADLRGIQGLEYSVGNEENGVLNERAINVIRAFPNEVVSWGARTTAGDDNSDNEDYKYVPVRRLTLLIEDSLAHGLQFTEEEQNSVKFGVQVRLAVSVFMHDLFRQGAFKGENASDAWFVTIESGRLIVGFAPLKPACFVVIERPVVGLSE